MKYEFWKKTGGCIVYAWFLCATFSACGRVDEVYDFSGGSLWEDSGENPVWESGASGGISGTETENENPMNNHDRASGENEKEEIPRNWIYVHVCGAVVKEGVYRLPEGSRGADALEAAGGFGENAATGVINLAAVITDGEKIYFPNEEEAENFQVSQSGEKENRININTADETLLCALTGIGQGRARDIIAYREKNGPFETTEDIMKVSGIKESVYQKICDSITVK